MVAVHVDISAWRVASARSTAEQPQRGRGAGQPDVIGMHGGLPPAAMFPFTSLSFTGLDPFADDLEAQHAQRVAAHGTAANGTAARGAAATHGGCAGMIDDPVLLATMQQYNVRGGCGAALEAWLRKLVLRTHAPARDDTVVGVTPGTSTALDATFRMLLDTRDVVLVESFMYSQVRAVGLIHHTHPCGQIPGGRMQDVRTPQRHRCRSCLYPLRIGSAAFGHSYAWRRCWPPLSSHMRASLGLQRLRATCAVRSEHASARTRPRESPRAWARVPP